MTNLTAEEQLYALEGWSENPAVPMDERLKAAQQVLTSWQRLADERGRDLAVANAEVARLKRLLGKDDDTPPLAGGCGYLHPDCLDATEPRKPCRCAEVLAEDQIRRTMGEPPAGAPQWQKDAWAHRTDVPLSALAHVRTREADGG